MGSPRGRKGEVSLGNCGVKGTSLAEIVAEMETKSKARRLASERDAVCGEENRVSKTHGRSPPTTELPVEIWQYNDNWSQCQSFGDGGQDSFEHDAPLDRIKPPNGFEPLDDGETLKPMDEKDLLQEFEPFLIRSGMPTSFSPIEENNKTPSAAPAPMTADTTTSISHEISLSQALKHSQSNRRHDDQGTFGALAPDSRPKHDLTPKQSDGESDNLFSRAMSFAKSPSSPPKIQPPPVPTHGDRKATQPTVRDYRNGLIYPIDYLSLIRKEVDPTLSNDNWGDEYYFRDSNLYRYIDDCRRGKATTDQATMGGLNRLARKVPLRTMKKSWLAFEKSLPSNKLTSISPEYAALLALYRQIQQRVHAKKVDVETTCSYVGRDLDPRLREQEFFQHGSKLVRGSNFGGTRFWQHPPELLVQPAQLQCGAAASSVANEAISNTKARTQAPDRKGAEKTSRRGRGTGRRGRKVA